MVVTDKYPKSLSNLSYDSTLGKMKVTIDGEEYIDDHWTKLVKPDNPVISTTDISVITGDANFVITSNVTTEYCTYNGKSYGNWTEGSVITIPSGFTLDGDHSSFETKVKVRAKNNGKYSDEVSYTLIVRPMCAAPTITVVRNGNNNEYSTSAVITIGLSGTYRSTTEYKASSSDWTEATREIDLTTNVSVEKNYFQARASKSGYVQNTVTSPAITLNTPKMYYGGITTDITTIEQVKALTPWEQKTLPQKLSYSGYIRAVFAYPKSYGALTSIMDGSGVTNYFNNFTRTEIGSYYVYTLNDAAQHDSFIYQFIK